jgi:hypothetical protein
MRTHGVDRQASAGPAYGPRARYLRPRISLLATLCCLSCTGVIIEPDGSGGSTSPGSPNPEPGNRTPTPDGSAPAPVGSAPAPDGSAPAPVGCAPAPARLVRLSPEQYERTIVSVAASLGAKDPTDEMEGLSQPFVQVTSGRFSTQANLQVVDTNSLNAALSVAESLGARLAPLVRGQNACLSTKPPATACLQTALGGVGRLLWRRPLSSAESDRFVGIAQSAVSKAASIDGVDTAVGAMIFSPSFVFRTEIGEVATGDTPGRLTAHEIASALSYALTDGPPDEVLRAEADSGAIREPARIREHVRRLLTSSGQFSAPAAAFVRELFAIEELERRRPDMVALAADTDSWIADVVARSASGPLFESVLTDTATFAQESTATYYGAAAPSSNQPVRVTPSSERVGILAQPSWLAARAILDGSSYVNSIAQRGIFVLDTLLDCQPPALPANVPPISDSEPTDNGPMTYRQRWEQRHTGNATCRGCHAIFDPLGVAFEDFDAEGRAQTMQDGLPIDSSSKLTTRSRSGEAITLSFSNHADLMRQLAKLGAVKRIMIAASFQYWMGRVKTDGDGCTLSAMMDTYDKEGWVAHLGALFTSTSFLEKGVAQ